MKITVDFVSRTKRKKKYRCHFESGVHLPAAKININDLVTFHPISLYTVKKNLKFITSYRRFYFKIICPVYKGISLSFSKSLFSVTS